MRASLATSMFVVANLAMACAVAQPIDIGSRLELMVDDYLVDEMKDGARFVMHHPTPREVVIVHDAAWEGSGGGYHTVFQDGDVYRMYYHAWHLDAQQGKVNLPHEPWGAYAESKDGIHWTKPALGLFDYQGSKENNLVCLDRGGHDFTPFKDTNPDCRPGEEYKAIAWAPDPSGVYAFKSSDAVRWSLIQDGPVMTGAAFDTQNLAFWDSVRGEYRAYVRDFDEKGIRGIKTTTSRDFVNWTELVWLVFPGAPSEHLYTNQVKPYYRAPHIYIGFPSRYTEREWGPSMEALPHVEHRRIRSSAQERYGTAITDALFMTSRDGLTFKRWGEAFIRPGLRESDNWAYGDNYIAWHVVETRSDVPNTPNELSLYATESYWTGNSSQLRRYTMRIDGFVSVQAPLSGGEFTTKPLVFDGRELVLNYSTSGAGGIGVELQDEQGNPIEGFALADTPEIFGDSLEQVVAWKDGRDLSALSGKPVRLRFVMKDADLYALRFRK